MSLSDDQWQFAQAVTKLLGWAAVEPGYKITFGCARCAMKGHHKDGSYHYQGLAIDLNLFIDGVYQDQTEAHRCMGERWESLGGTWGGRFSSPDGNHYSWGEGR